MESIATPSFYWIDTHTHHYDEGLAHSIAQTQAAQQAGVQKMYLPNLEWATVEPMLALHKARPEACFPMLGLHPCHVKEDYEEVLGQMKPLLEEYPFIGIGETGLDFYWDTHYKKEQITSLEIQMDWAAYHGLAMSLHARNSLPTLIEMVKKKQKGELKGVFHCFSGTLDEAQQVIDLGFALGVGGIITFKKSHLPEVFGQLPLEVMLLETDAPYLAPVPYRGKKNQPAYLVETGKYLAGLQQRDWREVAQVTSSTAETLFQGGAR